MEIIADPDKIPENDQTQIKDSMFPPTAEEAAKMQLQNCIRILPHHQDTGCFFVAALVKKSFLPWQKVSEGPNPEVVNDGVSAVHTFSRKKRKVMGYKEDPFIFFKQDDPAWVELRDFYKMENFPDNQLLTRCKNSKKRNIYFVSEAVKNILENNENKIKIVNSGLRLFCRSDNKGPNCNFRVTQEGVATVMPFVNCRILEITVEDIAHLLTKEYPPLELMCEETLSKLEHIDTGSVLLNLNTNDLLGNPLVVQLCGWKGKQSLRCYVPRSERLHYLRLCNVDISKYETNPSKKYKYKLNEDEDTDPVKPAEDELKVSQDDDSPTVHEENVNSVDQNQTEGNLDEGSS